MSFRIVRLWLPSAVASAALLCEIFGADRKVFFGLFGWVVGMYIERELRAGEP